MLHQYTQSQGFPLDWVLLGAVVSVTNKNFRCRKEERCSDACSAILLAHLSRDDMSRDFLKLNVSHFPMLTTECWSIDRPLNWALQVPYGELYMAHNTAVSTQMQYCILPSILIHSSAICLLLEVLPIILVVLMTLYLSLASHLSRDSHVIS